MATEQTTLEGETVDEPDPKVLSVVSCGQSKQDLADGETVPARELYTSSIHVCKDRYGQHSHGYYIASAKFGLVHQKELPEYDQTLPEMSDEEVREWADDVSDDLVFVARSVASEGVRLGDVDGDDPGSEELLRLCYLVQQSVNGLQIHLSNHGYREVTKVLAMGVAEWCPVSVRLVNEAPSALVGS